MAKAKDLKIERVRRGVLYTELGDVHRGMLDKMVELDHSNPTTFTRWMLEEEWKRRGLPPLVAVIGDGVEGAKSVPVFGTRQ